MLRRVALFGLGLSFVLGARLATREAPPEPPPELRPEPPALATQAVAPTAISDRAGTVPAADADPAACAELQTGILDRMDALQDAADGIQELELLLSGEPLPWPDDVPDAFREASVRDAFEAAAAAVGDGLVLRELRCDEYPCIGIFEVPRQDGPREGLARNAESAIAAAVREQVPGAVVVPLDPWRGGGPFAHQTALAMHAPALGDAERSRMHHRWQDYQTDVRGWRWVRHFDQ